MAVVLYVNIFVMGCVRSIYSNLFRSIMAYLPVTKHPPVSTSAAELANFLNVAIYMYWAIQALSCTFFKRVVYTWDSFKPFICAILAFFYFILSQGKSVQKLLVFDIVHLV